MPSSSYLAGRYGLPIDSDPAFIAGYLDIWRQDAIRSSCMECVEKHLGSALVLMDEAENGYPEHKLLAIGHLNEASQECALLRPKLSQQLREIRKAYQSGEAVSLDAIAEALKGHGVWRFDRKGEGVACGQGWISRSKKCSKGKRSRTPDENIVKTRQKARERFELRRQVEENVRAGRTKAFVKPQAERKPGEPPHKNPQTPQEYIENGRAIAGEFLGQAKTAQKDVDLYQGMVVEAKRQYEQAKGRIEDSSTIAAQAFAEANKDPEYQKLDEQMRETFGKRADIKAREEKGEITSVEAYMLKGRLDVEDSKIRTRQRAMRAKISKRLAEQDKSLEPLRKQMQDAQASLEKATQPATDFTRKLLSTSTLSRQDSEAIAKKIKKPSGYKTKDPQLTDRLADFMQLTNGKGSQSLNRVTITRQRAHATRDGLARYYGKGRHDVLYHEMAHHAEFEDKALEKVAGDWVKSRASGDMRSLRDITGSKFYKRSEKAYPDEFITPYVGKIYRDGGTEVLSVGMEHFASPELMVRLAAKDPDHFALILGMMRS